MREPLLTEFDEETYLLWESRQHGRFEMHHGFVFGFAGGTLDQARIAHNLRVILDRSFPAPCRSVGSDVKLRIDATTYYYPDAMVVCTVLPGDAVVVSEPLVVGEVLSPGTRRVDVVEKRAAYRALPSVTIFVIAHTETRRLEVDHRLPDRRWQTTVYDGETISLGESEFELAELYDRTSLAV